MEFRARGSMTVAGIDIAAAMIRKAGADAALAVSPGDVAAKGELLLSARGPAGALHLSWKAAQTLTEVLSGIATATRMLARSPSGLARLDLLSLSARRFADAAVCNGCPRLCEADPGVHAFGLKSGFAPPIRFHQRAADQKRIREHQCDCRRFIQALRLHFAGFHARA